ncbi:N-acetylmuramoyl-L-alanine amidase [Clostridium botulinum]|uniref:N-acetylmuramoyl-L-alanine amidase n=1 Tax=Clostridium botulinum TaxID=1491 RepID=UPI00137619C6|nr:N-acetylmuramoyl-L-alanine amidase [Clostridium botulinum]NCI19887.1 N-acetylmuramoyl-L-alanine amidase [Clostridium botulinum]NCI35649.1 N-acetylmuramoyl-L-alanine amidase [Clostridium botulinum]NCI71782.1 N-acetylmuramoyl-L-alanine amidase [Clostridium botulinum]NDI38698.1 N-acetylmuramoyl-L-alanine amidase [Clostridium botulinum]
MKIGMRGGHSPNCKGASGYLDEQNCVRELYYKIKPLLEAQGHTVIDCNSNASSVSGELNEGTNKCNNAGCDLYIPLHMNASNGQGNGVECWTYSSSSSIANAIGSRICSNLASLGLQNRGVKHNTGYHDTRAVKGQTCLIEILFCDNKHDCDIWNNVGINKIARLIASAICNKAINTNNIEPKKEEKKVKNIICYQHGLNENAANYLGDFLNCSTIEAHRPYDYKNVENVFAIGGDKKAYTSYLKTHITGTTDYNAFERTIGYILTKRNIKWNVTKYDITLQEKNAKNKLIIYNNYVDKRAAEYLATKLNCSLKENKTINAANYDFIYLVGDDKDAPQGSNIRNIKGQDRYLTAKEVIDFMKFV